jgi:hypothetical protein
MSISKHLIRRLSQDQRDMLIEHIDRIVPIDQHRGRRTLDWLLEHKLLKGHPSNTFRPTGTSLTQDGRAAVCIILGECADALIRAGLLELDNTEETPLEVLRRMRAERVIPRFAGYRPPKRA